MERSEFYQRLFKRAKEAGFSACEAYYAAGESFSVTVFGGEITDYSASESRGLGFRGLVDGRMGYASTQALDEDSIALLVEGRAGERAAHRVRGRAVPLCRGGEVRRCMQLQPRHRRGFRGGEDRPCKSLETMAVGMDARLRREAEASVFSESGEVEIVNTLGCMWATAPTSSAAMCSPWPRKTAASAPASRCFLKTTRRRSTRKRPPARR